jgi:hypothetical protein
MDVTWLGPHRHSELESSVAVTTHAVMEPIIKTSYMTSSVYGKTVALGPIVWIATDS